MNKRIEWILRIAVAGEFIGHGIFGLQAKSAWVAWAQELLGVNLETATTLIILVGIMDILLGILVIVKTIRPALLFMAIWGFWTALLRPIVGEPVADFIERWSNWGAPLALYYLLKR